MNLQELAKHHKIGIDVDGTLIDHPRSHLLQRFILDHHQTKEFYIITFRSHGWEKRLEHDIGESTLLTTVPLQLNHFRGIHTVPQQIHENHWMARSCEGTATPGSIIIAHDDFYGWKAAVCREIGCTVLIDDMEPSIGPHCVRLGVVCLNPNHY